MSVRMRITRSKTGKRRGGHKSKMPTLTNSNGNITIRHRATKEGVYRDRKVFEIKQKKPDIKAPEDDKKTEEVVEIPTTLTNSNEEK